MGGSQASPTPTPFGELLRRWRREAGWSQGVLAERASLSRNGVNSLERGVVRRVRRETVQLLADALQLEPQARAAFEAAARVSASRAARLPAPHPHVPTTAHGPAFVGRQPELARIERHLAATDRLAAPVLFFAGEPGIGKSRLLHEAGEHAAASGWRVLAGGCTRRSGQEPYAPFAEMLARSLAPLSLAEQRRALQGCAWLVRLLPELLETAVVPAPTWSLPPEQERRLMFAAVARYLANVAGPAGTLLLLDDLQWAGAGALDLLESLARTASEATAQESAAGSRLRILAAYRSTEVNVEHPIATVQADLARMSLAERHALGSLSPADANALAQDLLTDVQRDKTDHRVLVEQLIERAGDVPFYLVNCAQAMRVGALGDEGVPQGLQKRRAAASASGGEVPWAVAEITRQRVGMLTTGARDLLAVAAVIGRVVPHALLEAGIVASEPISDNGFLPALDEALRARLLVEREEEQPVSGRSVEYQFAHDLIREVILQDLSVARRVQLHRVVASTLEQLAEAKGTRERVAAELADHFRQAAEPARALPYALLAGDQAEAVYAHAEAEHHYRMAVDLAHDIGDQAREAEALEKLSRVLVLLARYEEGRATYERAILRYQCVGDRRGELRSWSRLLEHLPEEGLERVRPLLATVEAEDEPAYAGELAAVYSGLAQSYWTFNRYWDMKGAATHAEGLARAQGDDTQLLEARYWRLSAAEQLGELTREEQLQEWLGLIPLAKRLGQLYVLCFAYGSVAQIYRYDLGDFALAATYLERMLEVAEQRGGLAVILGAQAEWMDLHYYMGEWDRVQERGRRASALQGETSTGETPWGWYFVLLQLGAVDLAQGRQQSGKEQLEEVITRSPPDLLWKVWPNRLLAEQEVLDGDAAAAHSRLQQLLDHPGMQDGILPPLLPVLAWAQLALNRDDEAAATLALAKSRCGRLWLVDALRVEVMLAIKQRRWDDAVAALDEALSMCRAMPYPYAEAKALYVYGQMYAAKGEPDSAREKYRAALAICERLGEGLYRPHTERALSR